MTPAPLVAKRDLNRSPPRRRSLFYAAYGSAVISVATMNWAILCWRSVLDEWGPDFDLVPRLLMCLMAVITLGICAWCFRHIGEAGLYLFREEALPLYVGTIGATLATIVFANRMARAWLFTPKICILLPLSFGGLLILFVGSRLLQLYELPSRQRNERGGGETDPLYRFGQIVLTLAVGIASSIAGFFLNLDRFGTWAPFLLGLVVAALFSQCFRLIFHQAALKRADSAPAPPLPSRTPAGSPLRNHNVRAPVVLTK